MHFQSGALFSLVLSYNFVNSFVYIKINEGLSSFPNDLSMDVNEIYVSENDIHTVEYVTPYPNLTRIEMTGAKLSMFPNVANVSSVLECLDLGENKITDVPVALLDKMVALRYLYLPGNKLTSFPDSTGLSLVTLIVGANKLSEIPVLNHIGRTLRNYQVFKSGLQEVSQELLAIFPNLRHLNLRDNPDLHVLPNFCLINLHRKCELNLKSLQLNCDGYFFWLKVADATGHVVVLEPYPTSCSSSVDGSLRPWSEITTDDIMHQLGDQGKHMLFTPMASPRDMHCVGASQTFPTVHQPSRCAYQCLITAWCYMFSLQDSGCVIVTASPGRVNDFSDQYTWYTVTF